MSERSAPRKWGMPKLREKTSMKCLRVSRTLAIHSSLLKNSSQPRKQKWMIFSRAYPIFRTNRYLKVKAKKTTRKYVNGESRENSPLLPKTTLNWESIKTGWISKQRPKFRAHALLCCVVRLQDCNAH